MKDSHWAAQKEKTFGYWNVRLMLVIFRNFPVILMKFIAFPVGLFYFLFSKDAREHSRAYIARVSSWRQANRAAQEDGQRAAKKLRSLPHFFAFALALVEKVEAWGGKALFKRIRFCMDDMEDFIGRIEKGQGAVLLSSHLGNMEYIRALAQYNRTGVSREIRVNAIVDFSVSPHFNRMLGELNPNTSTWLVPAKNMGPDTVIQLQERVQAGELVVIAGDRTAQSDGSRYLSIPFLGENAPFPYGPFLLASLMDAPVYSVFALREKDVTLRSSYLLHMHKSPLSFDCSRREREERIKELARWFADYLAHYCAESPYQWYNYYNFWRQ